MQLDPTSPCFNRGPRAGGVIEGSENGSNPYGISRNLPLVAPACVHVAVISRYKIFPRQRRQTRRMPSAGWLAAVPSQVTWRKPTADGRPGSRPADKINGGVVSFKEA